MGFLPFENIQGNSVLNAEQAKLLTQGRIMIPPKKVNTHLKNEEFYMLEFDPERFLLRVTFFKSEDQTEFRVYKVQKHDNGSIYIGNLLKIFKQYNLNATPQKARGEEINVRFSEKDGNTVALFNFKKYAPEEA